MLHRQPVELFNPELYYTKGSGAFPGSWLSSKLADQDYSILLPLTSELRDYFTSDDLQQRVELTPINTPSGPGLRVTLKLTLSGFEGAIDYSCYRDYPLKSENEIRGAIPTLALWPFVPETSGWREYYLLAETTEGIDLAFHIQPPLPTASVETAQDVAESYQYWRCEQCPQVLVAVDSQGKDLGLIPLRQPRLSPTGISTWSVGVDVDHRVTHVAVQKDNKKPAPLLLKTLVQSISRTTDIQEIALREFFVPAQLLPEDASHSVQNVLTTRGWDGRTGTPTLISQVRLYVPRLDRFEFDKDYLHTGIDWQAQEQLELFLGLLLRLVAAQAAAEGVTHLRWTISYPSRFSRRELNGYRGSWHVLVDSLNRISGQAHEWEPDRGVRSASTALAHYWREVQQQCLVHTSCIDMGQTSTELSIWQDEQLLHQVTVPYTGQDLFHRILNPSDKASNLKYLGDVLGLQPDIARCLVQNLNGKSRNFDNALETYLRGNAKEVLRNRYRIASLQSDHPANAHFRTLMAFAAGGLYHYLGILLGTLKAEGQLKRAEPTLVLMGGHGSQFLQWLVPDGGFRPDSEVNLLLDSILAQASQFQSQRWGTRVSEEPDLEVSQGLATTSATGWLSDPTPSKRASIIPGIHCRIRGRGPRGRETLECAPADRLQLPRDWEEIEAYEITDFSELNRYVTHFHRARGEHGLEWIHRLGMPMGPAMTEIDAPSRHRLERYIQGDRLPQKDRLSDLQNTPGFLLALQSLIRLLAEDWAFADHAGFSRS